MIFSFLEIAIISQIFLMTALWGLSLRLKDASIVDRYWGINFFIIGMTYLAANVRAGLDVTGHQIMVLILLFIWGSRLSIHLHLRNRNHGEDFRYQKMRRLWGQKFWWISLFSVFWLQASIALVVAFPLLAMFLSQTTASSGVTKNADYSLAHAFGFVVWMLGFACETIADHQLKQFKKNPNNRGKLLTTGLWSLTRHPNYFGDALVWFGFYFLTFSWQYSWTIIGPLVMAFFLRYVSGVKLLEKSLRHQKPDYALYQKTTPAFVPNGFVIFAGLMRFSLLMAVKLLTRLFYRFEVSYDEAFDPKVWPRVRLALLLNHTSLWEPLLAGALHWRYLWHLSFHGIFPVADITMNHWFAGKILKLLTPKVITITRKRDHSWKTFLAAADPRDTMIFIPEGRMKRADGLDKFGNPVIVRTGVLEVLEALNPGPLLIVCSGGLSHISPPGSWFPRLFKTIRVGFASTDIATYLSQWQKPGVSSVEALTADLTKRRDEFCR